VREFGWISPPFAILAAALRAHMSAGFRAKVREARRHVKKKESPSLQREFDVNSRSARIRYDPVSPTSASLRWEFRMSAPAAKHLPTPVAILLGIFLVWAGGTVSPLRAHPAQGGAAQAPPPAAPAAQSPSAAPQAPSDAPEMDSHEAPIPLQTRVSAVPMRVVVRDGTGHTVANLQKDDFQLFEDGKPQIISNFAVETPASLAKQVVQPSPAAGTPGAPPSAPAFLPPSRFIALLFDDPHLNLQDLMQARNAAIRYLDSSVTPTDRVAVYTISGQMQVDFTEDHAKLRDTLAKLQPREVTAGAPSTSTDCPPMDYYEADAIQNRNDQTTIGLAMSDALTCQANAGDAEAEALTGQPSPAQIARAQAAVTSAALRVEQEGAEETEYAFRRLKEVIQRLANLPGQRSIVLISPGFIYPNREVEFSEIIDRAIRSSVFINTLDARGLYVPDLGGDISEATNDPTPVASGYRTSLRLEGQGRQTEVLMSLATDTGGYSFHGNNDLGEGLRQVAAAPETYYYIAFVPQNLKYDGKLHSLKVTLRSKEKYTVQARRGYYAPLHGDNPVDAAKQDIEDAIFSQEEQHGLPVALQTQYYKTDAADAKLSVLAHVDLAHIRFVKSAGRNQNELTVVAALFDRNGNFITGTQRVVQMKLRDETLEKLSHSGVTVRTSFDVKPGDYVVRLVVRDSTAAPVSAENGVVEIPY